MLKKGFRMGILTGAIIGILIVLIVEGSDGWNYSPCGGYPSEGRILAYFDDGRFILLHIGHEELNPTTGLLNSTAVLYDQKYDKTVDNRVFRYREKKPYVYTVGTSGFTIVNYETGQVKQVKEQTELSATERKNFLDKKKFEVVEADFVLPEEKAE